MTEPTPSGDTSRSYFERLGTDRFRPTGEVGGAWREDEQHFSPLGGLIVHAIQRHRASAGSSPDLALSRISFDILGQLALDDFTIEVRTSRPGRTIELIEATVVIAERAAVNARAWFLSAQDTSAVAGGEPAPLPSPDSVEPWPMGELWPGGFIASIDVRTVDPPRPGRAIAWVSTPVPLLVGEPVSSLASYVARVDTANGIAVRRDPTAWMFPNVDLTIHLYRAPESEWTGLDTEVVFGAEGLGLTSTVLHDVRGPVGRAAQSLTIRPLG